MRAARSAPRPNSPTSRWSAWNATCPTRSPATPRSPTAARELVVMLNNDVDARPDFLERLAVPFAADGHVGSVASLLLRPGSGDRQRRPGRRPDPRGFARHQGLPAARPGTSDPRLTGPAGAAAAFRRAAWEQVGGMDERIPAYMEDFELGLRLRQAGWTTALARDAVAVHIGGATSVTARRGSAGVRVTAGATCCAATACWARARRGASWPPRRSSLPAISRSRETPPRPGAAWPGGGPPAAYRDVPGPRPTPSMGGSASWTR